MRRSSGILPAIKKSTRRGRSLGPIVAPDYAAPMMASQTAHSSAGSRCCTRTGGWSRASVILLSFPTLWPSFATWKNVSLLPIGTVLFGAGLGKATSMLPLVAQREFFEHAQPGARIWSVGSGFVRRWCRNRIFIAAALVQGIAICAFLLGRSRQPRPILVTMSKSSARAERKRTVRLVPRTINECERLAHPVRSNAAPATDRSPRQPQCSASAEGSGDGHRTFPPRHHRHSGRDYWRFRSPQRSDLANERPHRPTRHESKHHRCRPSE